MKIIVDENICEIASFYILEKYRGMGYGKQVIAYMQKEFEKKRLLLWVLEDNLKARHFYENNGFKKTGEMRIINRGKTYTQRQYEFLSEVWS